MHRIAVYGSLLTGLGNHGLLRNYQPLSTEVIQARYRMGSLGGFPGLVSSLTELPIHIEVYEVDTDTFNRVRMLEGFNSVNPENGLYREETVRTSLGDATIYVYNGHIDSRQLVNDGNWRNYINNRH